MYKVFINEHLLKLCELQELSSDSESQFQLYSPDCKEIELMLEYLSKQKNSTTTEIVYNDVQVGFESFKDCFSYLEAAGGIITDEENNLLMIHRLGKWDLPKGKIEQGEVPTEAAIREVKEECGLKEVKLGKEFPSSFHIYFHKATWHLKRTYWFHMDTSSKQELVPQEEEGIVEVKWISPDQIKDIIEDTYESLKPLLV